MCDEYGVYLVLPFLEEVSCPGSFLIYIAGLFLGELELDLNGEEGDGDGGSVLSILWKGYWCAVRWVEKWKNIIGLRKQLTKSDAINCVNGLTE